MNFSNTICPSGGEVSYQSVSFTCNLQQQGNGKKCSPFWVRNGTDVTERSFCFPDLKATEHRWEALQDFCTPDTVRPHARWWLHSSHEEPDPPAATICLSSRGLKGWQECIQTCDFWLTQTHTQIHTLTNVWVVLIQLINSVFYLLFDL